MTTAQQLTEAEIARAERLRLSDLLTEHKNDIADACRDPRAAVALVALLLRMESMLTPDQQPPLPPVAYAPTPLPPSRFVVDNAPVDWLTVHHPNHRRT